MAAFKAGDRVRIVTRDVTPEDVKSQLYFAYFGGLTGTVDRTYDDTVCVDVDLQSLTDEMRDRHLSMQEAERQRWISNLSDEVRNRLSAEQKQLRMSYRILVSKKDLETYKDDKPQGEARPEATKPSGDTESKKGSASPGPSARTDAASVPASPKVEKDSEPPKRLSEADLSAAEEEFLRSRQATQN
jgi:ribosomal protein L21E